MLSIRVTELLFQALQLVIMLDIAARQLLVIKHCLLLQFSTQLGELLVLLRGSRSRGATSLLLLFSNTAQIRHSVLNKEHTQFSHPIVHLPHMYQI